jgi:hypothetical protein
MQGNQFNLNKKYIGAIRLPNLSDTNSVPASLLDELATLGRSIADGEMPDPDVLDLATASAYRLALSRIRSILDPASTEMARA